MNSLNYESIYTLKTAQFPFSNRPLACYVLGLILTLELFLFTHEKSLKSAKALKDALYLQYCFFFLLRCMKAAEEGQQTGKEQMYT